MTKGRVFSLESDGEPAGDQHEEVDGDDADHLESATCKTRQGVEAGFLVGRRPEGHYVDMEPQDHQHGDDAEEFEVGVAGFIMHNSQCRMQNG